VLGAEIKMDFGLVKGIFYPQDAVHDTGIGFS
jgi:hypothetical protein